MSHFHRMSVTIVAVGCVSSLMLACGGGDDNPVPVGPVTITVAGPNAVSYWNEVATTTINVPASATGTPEEQRPIAPSISPRCKSPSTTR